MDKAVEMLPLAVAEADAPLVVLLTMRLSFNPAEGAEVVGVVCAWRGQKERTRTTFFLDLRNCTQCVTTAHSKIKTGENNQSAQYSIAIQH